jgi:predicted Zn-dependent peptidase
MGKGRAFLFDRVESFELAPGRRLFVEQNSQGVSASCGVFFHRGSRHERPSDHGLTHMLEHLLFKGTTQLTAPEISREIETYGGELNAYTDRELTCFHAWVPESRIWMSLGLLFEMLFDCFFSSDDFEKEQSVVVQELKGYLDSPEDEFWDELYERILGKDPLGRRIAGTPASVSKFTGDHCLSYIAKEFYRAPFDIVVSSPRKAQEVKARVKQILKELEARGLWGETIGDKRVVAKLSKPPRRHLARLSGVKTYDTEQVQVALVFPGVSMKDPREAAFTAVAGLIGGGSSSKLFKELREKEGLVYSVGAFLSSFTDCGYLVVHLSCSKDDLTKAIRAVGRVVRETLEGISTDDLEFLKSSGLGSLALSYEGSLGRMDNIGRQAALLGEPISYQTLKDEIISLKLKDFDPVLKALAQTPLIFCLGQVKALQMSTLQRAYESKL